MPIQSAAILIAHCLPMVLVAFLLWRGDYTSTEVDATEAMLIELLDDEPKRLASTRLLQTPKLPSPKE